MSSSSFDRFFLRVRGVINTLAILSAIGLEILMFLAFVFGIGMGIIDAFGAWLLAQTLLAKALFVLFVFVVISALVHNYNSLWDNPNYKGPFKRLVSWAERVQAEAEEQEQTSLAGGEALKVEIEADVPSYAEDLLFKLRVGFDFLFLLLRVIFYVIMLGLLLLGTSKGSYDFIISWFERLNPTLRMLFFVGVIITYIGMRINRRSLLKDLRYEDLCKRLLPWR